MRLRRDRRRSVSQAAGSNTAAPSHESRNQETDEGEASSSPMTRRSICPVVMPRRLASASSSMACHSGRRRASSTTSWSGRAALWDTASNSGCTASPALEGVYDGCRHRESRAKTSLFYCPSAPRRGIVTIRRPDGKALPRNARQSAAPPVGETIQDHPVRAKLIGSSPSLMQPECRRAETRSNFDPHVRNAAFSPFGYHPALTAARRGRTIRAHLTVRTWATTHRIRLCRENPQRGARGNTRFAARGPTFPSPRTAPVCCNVPIAC